MQELFDPKLVEFQVEEDGRWLADYSNVMPGAMAYGKTQQEALNAVREKVLSHLASKAKRQPSTLVRSQPSRA